MAETAREYYLRKYQETGEIIYKEMYDNTEDPDV